MELVKILRCKCGEKGAIYKADSDNMRRPYFVQCSGCGKKSQTYLHIESAIEDWNKRNACETVKPKYHCGLCGKEIDLGFEKCPKCGAEIDWR